MQGSSTNARRRSVARPLAVALTVCVLGLWYLSAYDYNTVAWVAQDYLQPVATTQSVASTPRYHPDEVVISNPAASKALPLLSDAPTAMDSPKLTERKGSAVSLPDVMLSSCAESYFVANFQRSVATPSSVREREAATIPEATIDVVYMIHYTPMRRRRVAMTELMAKHRIGVVWVEGFDKEVLNESTAACFHSWNRSELVRANDLKKAARHDVKRDPLGKSQRSVVVKHHSALYDMYRMGYQRALVLEDDAFLRVSFRKRLAEVMLNIPATFDVVMIGGCMNMHAWRRKAARTTGGVEMLSKHVYRKREARCAHAFVVSQKGARRLLNGLPLTHAIDFQMTAVMTEQSMEVYWVEPWLSIQGPSPECVTMIDLKAGCVSTEKVTREYDPRFENNTDAEASWDWVPPFLSKR